MTWFLRMYREVGPVWRLLFLYFVLISIAAWVLDLRYFDDRLHRGLAGVLAIPYVLIPFWQILALWLTVRFGKAAARAADPGPRTELRSGILPPVLRLAFLLVVVGFIHLCTLPRASDGHDPYDKLKTMLLLGTMLVPAASILLFWDLMKTIDRKWLY